MMRFAPHAVEADDPSRGTAISARQALLPRSSVALRPLSMSRYHETISQPGTAPTLTPDFDEYGLYALRGMGPDGPGLAYAEPFQFVGDAAAGYGHSYDLDQIALSRANLAA